MLLKSAANTYAQKLMSKLDPSAYPEAWEDLKTFTGLCREEPRIKLMLGHPAIPDIDKAGLILSIADRGRFLSETKALLIVLLETGKLYLLDDIRVFFGDIVQRSKKRQTANITAAVPLSEEQIGRLKSKLSAYTERETEIRVTVDPSLVGGLIIRIGDKIIDASMTNVLANLRQSLIEGW